MVYLLGGIAKVKQLVLQDELSLLDLIAKGRRLPRVDDYPAYTSFWCDTIVPEAISYKPCLIRHEQEKFVREVLIYFFL